MRMLIMILVGLIVVSCAGKKPKGGGAKAGGGGPPRGGPPPGGGPGEPGLAQDDLQADGAPGFSQQDFNAEANRARAEEGLSQAPPGGSNVPIPFESLPQSGVGGDPGLRGLGSTGASVAPPNENPASDSTRVQPLQQRRDVGNPNRPITGEDPSAAPVFEGTGGTPISPDQIGTHN